MPSLTHFSLSGFITRTAILFAVMAAAFILQAQPTQKQQRRCGVETDWNELKSDPKKLQRYREIEAQLKQKEQSLSARITADGNVEYEIPVVFHIVDPNPNSIDDALIEIQLARLNEDFQGFNDDSTNAPLFYTRRGRTKFRFVMAQRTPEGCATTGITRTVSNLTVTLATVGNIKHNSSGGIDMWESYNSKYLNIWVGTFGPEPRGPFLGVATFPDGSKPANEQGVVIGKKTFSLDGNAFTEGRTLVHEVGHFFFLRHIWGDEDLCDQDDEVDDTPLQKVSTSGKPVGLLLDSCSDVAPGINYQNFMDYSDDQALTMFTKKQALRMLASLDLGTRSMLIDPDNKGAVPPKPNEYFYMCTSPAFTTNDFYAIGVGKGGYVWAGTSRQGIYRYDGHEWSKFAGYNDNLVWDIKADQKGGIWVAQAGRTASGTTAQTGGLNYFPDTTFPAVPADMYYSASDGLPSRYARGLFIDTSRFQTGTNPLVWTANAANVTGGTSSNGGVGRGFNAAAPRFVTIRQGLNVATTTQTINAVGGNAAQVWAIAPSNNSKTQILQYEAVTNNLIGIIDNSTYPSIFTSANFDARSIYFDKSNRKWIGLWGGGFVVNDGTNWFAITDPKIIPALAKVNANAIVGDQKGNVYIGTDSGLIIYKGGSLTNDSSYKRYTMANGLPHNNVRAICVDTLRKCLLIATANGIVFWNPTCASAPNAGLPYVTSANGDFNNPASWCGNVVPPVGSIVIVRHNITISNNTTLQSLKAEQGGQVTVAAGVLLQLAE